MLDHHHHHRASTPLLHYSCRKKGQTFQKEVKNNPLLTVLDHHHYHWASTLLLHQVGAKKELPIFVTWTIWQKLHQKCKRIYNSIELDKRMLFRHHIRSPLLNPRHFSPSTYFGIFCTAGALVVITVYRVSTSSITQSTSLTFCSKAHRACIKQRSNLTIPNNIFRHTC